MIVALSGAGVSAGGGVTLTLSAAGWGSRLLHAITAAAIATDAMPRFMSPPLELTPPPDIGADRVHSRARQRAFHHAMPA